MLPKFGEWHAIGMFRAANPADNFKTAFPVETEKFTPAKEYKGKRDMPTKWAKKDFKSEPTPLPEVGGNCATYVRGELDMSAAAEVPLSINAGGNTLTVWVNGEKVFSADKGRPEPFAVSLKLKQGKNELLVKMCDADRRAHVRYHGRHRRRRPRRASGSPTRAPRGASGRTASRPT